MSTEFIPFKESEVREMVSDAMEKFFSTMLDWPVLCVGAREGQTVDFDDLDAPPPPVLESDEQVIVGMVGFIGAVSGVLNVHMKESMALDVTSNFLGMTLEEIHEEGMEVVNDALGEMGNMVGGTFKNSLCDSGYDCRMTLPSILRGRNFTIETPAGVFRRIYDFKCLDRVFSADLTIKPGE